MSKTQKMSGRQDSLEAYPDPRFTQTNSTGFARRTLATLSACITLLLGAKTASSASLPQLVVLRGTDAADCPDATELARIVERQLKRPALDPAAHDPTTSTYTVEMTHAADGYSATIRTGEQVRELSDHAATCAELADAVALMLAILLDGDDAAPETAPAPPPPPPPPEVPAKPVSPPSPKTTTTVIAPADKPARSWRLWVDVVAAQSVGFLSPWSPAFDATVSLSRGRFAFGTGLFTIPTSTISDASSSSIDAYLLAGELHGCGRLWGQANTVHFSLCSQSFLGAVHASGNGYAENRQGAKPWVSLGTLAILQGSLNYVLGWSVRLGIAVPVLRQQFTATRVEGTIPNVTETTVTVFDPPPVAGFLGFGLRWTIL